MKLHSLKAFLHSLISQYTQIDSHASTFTEKALGTYNLPPVEEKNTDTFQESVTLTLVF